MKEAKRGVTVSKIRTEGERNDSSNAACNYLPDPSLSSAQHPGIEVEHFYTSHLTEFS